LRAFGCQWSGDEYATAASCNNLEMIKFLLEEARCPKPSTNSACMKACGDLEILKYLHENGFKWHGEDDEYDPIDDGNYDEDVILPSHTILHRAVQYKSMPVLQYILNNGYELDLTDVSLCDEAVSKNDIEMFKYLVGRGCKSLRQQIFHFIEVGNNSHPQY
jgi:hypothetical protein